MKEATLYDKLESNAVKCHLCRHGCKIEDARGALLGSSETKRARFTHSCTTKWCPQTSIPLKKSPCFTLLPAPRSFSIATVGCNFSLQLLPELFDFANARETEAG